MINETKGLILVIVYRFYFIFLHVTSILKQSSYIHIFHTYLIQIHITPIYQYTHITHITNIHTLNYTFISKLKYLLCIKSINKRSTLLLVTDRMPLDLALINNG